MQQKNIDRIGWFASSMAMLMFCSYIDQIRLNISGMPGSVILPLVTIINSTSWLFYALLKEKKDWPIVACNALGILFGFITAITALIYSAVR